LLSPPPARRYFLSAWISALSSCADIGRSASTGSSTFALLAQIVWACELELGEAGHDCAHQLPAGGAEVEAEACLSQDADSPVMQVVEGLDEVLRPSRPSAELADQNGINLVGSRQ